MEDPMSLPYRPNVGFAALGATLACALALVACTSGGSDYISDNPFGSNNNSPSEGNGFGTSSGVGGGSDSAGSGGNDPGRAIAEADIIQIAGPRLYALS